MSTRSAASRSAFVYTGDINLNDIQQARNDVAAKVNANPLANAVVITGLVQTDGSTSDGVEFAVGQTRELAHGLGYRASGFVILDQRSAFAQLGRVAVTAGLEDTHIALNHYSLAPATTYVKLAIW